jgi:ATP-binding cassette subfamily F protein 3
MTALESSLKNSPDQKTQARMAARIAEIHERMNHLDMQFPLHRAQKILGGLGFKERNFNRPVTSLSGGWKMRAALASLLYQNPDLLLMDEPTNHLDLPSVSWLDEFLRNYTGAVVLICHDRDFLNRQTDRTIALEPEGMRIYSGNYDFFLKAREEEQQNLEARARNQEQKVKEAKRFVERFRAKASKARQAQSKIKLLDKMSLIETHRTQKSIRFSFPSVSRSGRDVLNIQGVSKAFGVITLYRHLNLRVVRGDRIAIIGPNGAGKTTLLRMIAGEIEPDEGGTALGHGVTMSYYAQHHSEMLDPRKTIVEEVYQVVPHESITFVRGVCGAFLFSGSDVEKTVGVLSGGEKARVALAKILVKPGNLMVMDEPTNHLDIISSELLIDALADFNGTLLFVSHNLSFVNRLATKIWDIREESILDYPGTLREYYEHLALREEETASLAHQDTDEDRNSRQGLESKKGKRREKAERRHLVTATLKPLQEKVHQLEERINGMEERLKELEIALADPEIFKEKDRSLPLLNEYTSLKKKLEELIGRWEYNQEELESAKRELGLLDTGC